MPSRGGGANRHGAGQRGNNDDGPLQVSSPLSTAGLRADPFFSSGDLIKQLLRIARGDWAAVHAPCAVESEENTSSAGGRGTSPPQSGHGVVKPDNGAAAPPTSAATAAGVSAVATALSPAVPVPLSKATVSHHANAGAANEPSYKELFSLASTNAARRVSHCVSSNEEVCAFYLTALVSQALHFEDYWVNLNHQIEVDQHVEFLQYCAKAGFSVLKTAHLMQWWRQYRALVRDEDATTFLKLSDCHPFMAPVSSPAMSVFGVTEDTILPSVDSFRSNSSLKPGGRGHTKGSVKRSRRGSASTTASDTECSTSLLHSLVTGRAYDDHDEAVQGELQRFARWEVEHEFEWRQIPKETQALATAAAVAAAGTMTPAAPTGATVVRVPGAIPLTSLGGTSAATASATGVPGSAGKYVRGDKAKHQQQLQLEQELEELRRACLATMPPENIYLSSGEMPDFVQYVLQDDLLSHGALHAYIATHPQPPSCTLTHTAQVPACFSVQVEEPMPVPSLKEAVRQPSQKNAEKSSTAQPAGTPGSTRPSSGTVLNAKAGKQSATVAAAAEKEKEKEKEGASLSMTLKGAGGTATVAVPPPILTPMEVLRAEQARETAAQQEACAREKAAAAAHAQAVQHAADVNLFFAQQDTNLAVQAIYEGMEEAVTARQQRILQRVAALERLLGLTEAHRTE